MASRVIYPPIVDSQMKAFVVGSDCIVYFSLSKFNASTDISSLHISVVEQITNKNYVNISSDNVAEEIRYRSTGIILDASFHKVEGEDNLFYTIIRNQDVSPDSGSTIGWTAGQTYKIQLRFSPSDFAGNEIGEAAWLEKHVHEFSEWSTVCIVKATDKVDYKIPSLDIDTTVDANIIVENENEDNITTFYISTLDLFGSFIRSDSSEYIKSYQFILYDADDNILEDSGIIFMDSNENNIDSFNFLSTVELEDQHIYKLSFKFETEHGYTNGFFLSYTEDGEEIDHRFKFLVSQVIVESPKCTLITADIDSEGILDGITTITQEEDNGRIGLKFYIQDSSPYSGNLCIRRSDSRSDFKIWTDIKIYVCIQKDINEIPIIYDYTIESGIWYKYGVQKISPNGERGIIEMIKTPIIRNFNYSFLLGTDNQQLRLMFDNTIPNYKYQIIESKIDPINAIYPIVTRNAATKYKTFPINGLISFWMDDDNTFTSRKKVYSNEEAAEKYQDYNRKNNIVQYDYIYEREFRNKVLDFLYDGKFKLFKSPTEGNIIVRLTDVNCIPNQSLDRMLYSFTSNAYEMDNPTMENYKKYNFYDPGTWASEFSTYVTKIGQIQMDVPVGPNIGYNILNAIYEKYDSKGQNCGGYLNIIKDVYCLKITFDSKPMKIKNYSGSTSAATDALGYNFIYSKVTTPFSVLAPNNIYEFDEKLHFTPNVDKIYIMGDADNKKTYVSVTIDFLYDLKVTTWIGKLIKSQSAKTVIGEFFEECPPDKNIYNELYYKYYIEWEKDFRRLNRISSIEIEANPGTVIFVRDESDPRTTLDYFTIGDTGKLNLHDLSSITDLQYIGIRTKDGTIDTTLRQDILIKYIAVVFEGKYKGD